LQSCSLNYTGSPVYWLTGRSTLHRRLHVLDQFQDSPSSFDETRCHGTLEEQNVRLTNSLDIDRREAAFPRRASRTGESVGSRRKKCYGATEYKIHLYRRNGISKGFVEVLRKVTLIGVYLRRVKRFKRLYLYTELESP
jgi:hypothetical protein